MIFAQQLHGMTEADTFGAHHPVDHRTACATRAETVPQIFPRADNERRRVVFVERAQADEVRSVSFQLHPARFGQSLHRDFVLEPLDLALRDARHRSPFLLFRAFPENLSRPFRKICLFQAVRDNIQPEYILSTV